MTLQVVGTGFGRTGTKSLKTALEYLGVGPCHHMMEVRTNPDLLDHWAAAANGELPDWDAVFKDYGATVDWPSTRFWREITDHFPAAKVIHTHRPTDKWLASIRRTILPSIRTWADRFDADDRRRGHMAWTLIGEGTFAGRIDDDDHLRAIFEAHTRAVLRTIPAERLLVYDVAEGWAPLCAFLDVEVPDTAFPHTNTAADFNARREAAARAGTGGTT